MGSSTNLPEQRRLHGMDPGKLLAVLGGDDAPPRPADPPGWEIVGIAGEGGSGIVWKARRLTDGVLAAIKFAPPEDLETVERLEMEARALRELDHAHIVRLLDAGPLSEGPQAGGLFLAMEYIDGSSLSEEIPGRGMSPPLAYDYFWEIAEAVIHAHDAAILHRDLKPSNILVDADGRIKVADFGLARPVHQRVQALSLTRAGVVAGSFEYLPPEAYRGGYRPDVAGDVYALGVLLHEMLTGSPPRGRWKPCSEKKGVDVRIDGLIERALDPDPDRRWPDVASMAGELAEIRRTPARFSGTPLVTLPVRLADALWTTVGIIAFVTAYGAAMRLAQSQVTPWIDVIGGHGRKTGSFQVILILLILLAVLSIWQFARLLRFRAVPMREALPSPFGLALGHGRLCALLVVASQVICLALPILLLVAIHAEAEFYWLTSGDPPWLHGLAVTPWDEGRILSPWAWPEAGTNYWLRESFGPPGDPLSSQVDRISFFPFLLPLMMTLAAILVGLNLIGTGVTASRRWFARKRRVASVAVILSLTALIFIICQAAAARIEKGDLMRQNTLTDWQERAVQPVRKLAEWRSRRASGDTKAVPPFDLAEIYAPSVDYRDSGSILRDELIKRFRYETKTPLGVRSNTWIREDVDREGGEFTVTCRAIEWVDGGSEGPGNCGATRLLVKLVGEFRDGRPWVFREQLVRQPYYKGVKRLATPVEATRWIDAFLTAIHSDPRTATSLLHSLQLRFGARRPSREAAITVMEEIRRHRPLERDGSPIILGPAPGGRTLVSVPLRSNGQRFRCEFQLVNTGDAWQAVDFEFFPQSRSSS